MNDSLLGSEFARVVQESRSHRSRRHHMQPAAAPPPLLASPCLLSPSIKHRLATLSPPTSPVSGDSPLPGLASVGWSHMSPPPPPPPLATAPLATVAQAPAPPPSPPQVSTAPPLQARPALHHDAVGPVEQNVSSETCSQAASASCTGAPKLYFRLTPSAAMLETQLVTPPVSARECKHWNREGIHPAVSAMSSLSEPHPLNILADISSVAPKSPVKWDHTVPPNHLNVQKAIVKSSNVRSVNSISSARARSSEIAPGLAPLNTDYPSIRSIPVTSTKPAVRGTGGNSGPPARNADVASKPMITCPQCPSSFTERFNLNKHIRAVHERRRPYQCTTCFARFQQRDHMQKHEICVHKKLRQFSCDACGASFGWRGVLKKHRKSVHGIHE